MKKTLDYEIDEIFSMVEVWFSQWSGRGSSYYVV